MATSGKGIEIPITLGGVKEVRTQIKQLRGELINATDPKEVARLSENIGELSDKLKDANEKANVFASGSKFEQASNAFGLMGSQIASLDFEGAGESAALFANRIKSINPAEFGTQIKGLISVVGNLSRAFISMGASLLMNPIFLIAVAIVAIVAIIAILLNKLGFLKPILNAIGAVFGAIGDAIDWVIQQIKDFLDWIGLTNFAEQDAAQKAADAQQKRADAYAKSSKSRISNIDQEIRLAQLDGKNTVEMEIKKQMIIRQTAVEHAKALRLRYKALILSGDYDKEDIKKLHEDLATQRETIKNSTNDIKYIRAKDKKDRENSESEASKKSIENAQEENKKKIEAQKKYKDDRIAIEREIQDLTIATMKEGEEKERATINEKYKRAIADVMANEKYLKTERVKVISLLQQEQANELNAIDEAKQAEKVQAEKEHQAELAQIELDSKLELIDSIEAIENLIAEKNLSKEDIAINAVRDKYFAQIELAKKFGIDSSAIEQQQQAEIKKIKQDAADADAEREKKLNEQKLDAVKSGLSAIGNVAELWAGKDKERQRKAFQVQKVANIATATIDTYKGASSAFASAGNPILGAVFAAAVISAGLVNIAKIKNTEFGGGGASPSATTSSINTNTASATPSFAFQGGGNNGNNLNGKNDLSNITVKAYVSESEITSTQKKVNKYQSNAVL